MKIRPAHSVDLSFIERCAEAAFAPYIPEIGRKPAPMTADYDGAIQAGHVYIAEACGFIVFYPQGEAMHLETMAVDPASRGRGIGKALLAFCEEQSRLQGLSAVELYTNAKMTANLTLYPHLGFTQTHRKVQDGFDRVFFRKAL